MAETATEIITIDAPHDRVWQIAVDLESYPVWAHDIKDVNIRATDELGLYAVEDKMHVHDIHSTIMSLLGLDHTEVVYMHKGRPERVDLNEGHVNEKVFAG